MKKLQLFLALSLVTLFVNGQQNKFSLGINSSLDYYTIDFNSPQIFYNHQYKTTASYSYGLNVQYNFNEQLFLQSGASYSKKGYQLIYDFRLVAIDDPSLDPAIPSESKLKLSFINIPLMLGYYLKKEGKVRLSVATGVNNEILLKSSETTLFGGGKTKTSKILSQTTASFLSSAQLNLGIEYHLGNKLFFSITPYFRYGFNTINDVSINFNSISYGGVFSINFKLFTQKEEE